MQSREHFLDTQLLWSLLTESDRVLIAACGLHHALYWPLIRANRGLMTAIVERWHSETSTFHLPIGEITITLEDVYRILRLPITRELVQYDQHGGIEVCQDIFSDDELDEDEISWSFMLETYEPLPIVLTGMIARRICPIGGLEAF